MGERCVGEDGRGRRGRGKERMERKVERKGEGRQIRKVREKRRKG